MQKTTKLSLTLAALVCVITLSGSAAAAPGWRYSTSHGMSHCAFAAFGPGGAVVNTATTASGTGGVSITGEQGRTVTLRLICERTQTFDGQGQLATIGPEGTYTGPGNATVIGVETPNDRSTSGYSSLPKGREWTVNVGDAPQTYQLGWTGPGGSDSLKVTVAVVAPPADFTPQVQAAQQKADDAYSLAEQNKGGGRGWENRIFAAQAGYYLGLDSLSNNGDARQGWGLDLNLFLGSDTNWRFLTGVTLQHDFRQKPVVAAPNMPTNGFNSFVDWQTFYLGPKAGVEWMPAKWFQLQGWGSIGLLMSMDGTIPISQLPDRTLYSGESDTTSALGYRLAIQPGFVIAEHLVVGANIGLLGNFTALPKERGPEQICSSVNGQCLVRRDGHFLDVPLGFFVGGQL
jgi:hypothetical protein